MFCGKRGIWNALKLFSAILFSMQIFNAIKKAFSSPQDYEEGCRHRNEERYDAAYACFQRVLPSHENYPSAQFELGCFKQIRKEPSFQHFEKAADLGHTKAQVYVGQTLVAQGNEKGWHYLERAGTKSAVAAMLVAKYNMEMVVHRMGETPIFYPGERNWKKAYNYLRLAGLNGSSESPYQLYQFALDPQKFKKMCPEAYRISPHAGNWLMYAAGAGHPQALYKLGLFFLCEKEDTVQALKCFQEAAKNGSVEALVKLEEFYTNEAHFRPKLAEKYRTLRQQIEFFSKRLTFSPIDDALAKRGDQEALMKMATCYWLGIGDCERNGETAFKYIGRLRRINSTLANRFLSYFYWKAGDLELAKKVLNEEQKENRV